MKKAIVLIALVCLLVAMAGCATNGGYEGEPIAIPSDSQTERTGVDSGSDGAASTIEVDEVPIIAETIEELNKKISGAKALKAGENAAYDVNNLARLDYYYVPDADFEGYTLYQIEVTATRIFYYYYPTQILEQTTSKVIFDYDQGILIGFAREETIVDPQNPLAALENQMGVKASDGYIYDERLRDLTCQIENTWMSIRVPEKLNDLETLRYYSSVKKIITK